MQKLKNDYNIDRNFKNYTLNVTYYDYQIGRCANYSLEHTDHSIARSAQRGISDREIILAMDYGTRFFKQGMVFYAVRKKDLPKDMKHGLREKLNNTVVVMSGDSNQIITCYRSANAMKHLKNKSKKIK